MAITLTDVLDYLKKNDPEPEPAAQTTTPDPMAEITALKEQIAALQAQVPAQVEPEPEPVVEPEPVALAAESIVKPRTFDQPTDFKQLKGKDLYDAYIGTGTMDKPNGELFQEMFR